MTRSENRHCASCIGTLSFLFRAALGSELFANFLYLFKTSAVCYLLTRANSDRQIVRLS